MRNEGVHVDAARANYETSNGGLHRAGLVFSESSENPPFVWVDGILRKEDAVEHPPFQRFNKIPGMDFICYKSTLFKTLNEMQRIYPSVFDVYPRTFLLPKEFLDFQREHKAICGRSMQAPSWVVKPKNSCCGKGISIVQSVAEAQAIDYEAVIQQYIKPFLIDGHKFDFRFYILIASLDPLAIFIYKEGIARFCTQIFEFPTKSNRDKKFMHLTNTAINIENSKEPPSQFTKLATDVLKDIAKRYSNGKRLWDDIIEVSRAVIIGTYGATLSNLPKKCDAKSIQQKRIEYFLKKRKTNPEEQISSVNSSTVSTSIPSNSSTNTGLTNSVNPNSINLNNEHSQRAFINTSTSRPDNVRRTTNNLINSNKCIMKIARPNECPILIGQVVNYQFLPQQQQPQAQQPIIARVKNSSIQRRSLSLSPEREKIGIQEENSSQNEEEADKMANSTADSSQNPTQNENSQKNNENIPDQNENSPENERIENKSENEDKGKDEEKEEVKKSTPAPEPKPLPLRKRFFHILGIDIMIDSDMKPKVLELNDRPSLGVTVEFEKDLKESLICEAFEHVSPTGEWFGNSEKSRWIQIYPLPKEVVTPYPEIVSRLLNPLSMRDMDPQKQPAMIPKRNICEIKFVKKDRKKKKRSRRESK